MTVDIQPIQIWSAGQVQTATQFSCNGVWDNFDTTATLYYQLLDSEGVQLSQGNQTIDGVDYQNWSVDPDANTWIIDWSATQLGITII
jgi:hypothetical protein